MLKTWHWLDENLLTLITGFLLAIIPLYPKLPLFDVIPGYIVRVRIEDFLVAATIILWLIQLWRKKISFGPNPLAKPILAYLTVGIISMLSAVFVIRTVPLEFLHISKMVLHFLRRVEYFSLFFVFYSSVKSLKQAKIYLGVLIITVVCVTLYGFGQKYFYWPAFSTMNREFSKGWVLYLTQHARVLSTFGGHYDLAAYTMMMLILMWALFFNIERKIIKLVIFLILAGIFWLLILTASRTSFIAYIVGITALFSVFMFRKGILWAAPRWFTVVSLSIIIMLTFGDLSERFTKLLKIEQRLSGIKYLLLHPITDPPKGAQIALLENNLEAVTSISDFPPLPVKPTDVNEEIPDGLIATRSATGAAITTQVKRTYSKTALVYDLSTGIRLDALWPRAIQGFMRNPLLGKGYSTLNKTQDTEFTEAESTDNDYLRALGETGILGLLTFGWILTTVFYLIWRYYQIVEDKIIFAAVTGLGAIIVGLLVNAVYIDVFEASKIALLFWAIVGIILATIKFNQSQKQSVLLPQIPDYAKFLSIFNRVATKIYQSDKTYLLLIIMLAFTLRQYRIHEPLADWHSWRQADTSSVTRNYVRYGINVFYPRYDDLSSIPSGKPNPEGYRFVEFPLYNVLAVIVDKLFPGYNIEYSGRLASIFASLGSLIFIYLFTKKHANKKIAFIAAFYYAVLPYNVFWSRVILPEPTLVFLTLGMVYFFDRWVSEEKYKLFFTSSLFAMGAMLVKFSAIFFAVPMFYIAWKKWGRRLLMSPWIYIYAVISLIPFIFWRLHISQYPEGIPAYAWLFNGDGIRFKGAWFWWLFAERVSKMILGGWGVSLFVIGIIGKFKQNAGSWRFHWWLVGMLLYLVVFATGNVKHDYYQIILVPILCIFMAIGTQIILESADTIFHKYISRIVLSCVILFMLMFGWYQARDLYNINHPEIVEAGREFNRLISNRNVLVIAPYSGDTAFLYQIDRRGWPIMDGTIDEMLAKGADYYVSTNFDELTNKLIIETIKPETARHQYFKLLIQTEQFVIIQLVANDALPQP